MKMNVSQLSKRDLERLSAYLDGALNPKQERRLETRLQREPLLRTALDELRETAWLLRSLPEVLPPKRFMITPEMVGVRQSSRAYPAFKLATALLTVAFVFVLGLDVIGSTKGLVDLTASGADLPAMESAPLGVYAEREESVVGDVAAEPAAEETLMLEEAPAAEAYEPFLPDEDMQDVSTDLPEEGIAPTPTESIALEEGESGVSVGSGEEQEGDVASNASGRAVQDDEAKPESEDSDGVAAPSAPPTEAKALQSWRDDELRRPEAPKLEPIVILEIGLAIACVIFASVTLWLRKSTR